MYSEIYASISVQFNTNLHRQYFTNDFISITGVVSTWQLFHIGFKAVIIFDSGHSPILTVCLSILVLQCWMKLYETKEIDCYATTHLFISLVALMCCV